MAARRFGSVLLSANANSKLMKGKPGHDSTVTVVFCNPNNLSVDVSLAYVADPRDECTIEDSEWMIKNRSIPQNSFLEVKGIAVEADHQLIVKSTMANVTVNAFGFEEEIIV